MAYEVGDRVTVTYEGRSPFDGEITDVNGEFIHVLDSRNKSVWVAASEVTKA